MTFSVVIPAYNGERYIEEAILSVLNQTRKADEIIIHDDNSTDSTAAICKKYQTQVKYYYNENGPSGFVNGWNRSINLAKCDFISILHQDDLLSPSFLEESEYALKRNPEVHHLFTLCNYIGENNQLLTDSEEALKKYYNVGSLIIFPGLAYLKAYQKTYSGLPHIHRCPGVVTHKSVFESGFYYNPEAGHIADDDFFYRVGKVTPVIGIMRSLAAFRIHSGSETGQKADVDLVERLARDYVFQVKQWQDSDFLDHDARKYFEFWAVKYIFRCYYYALKASDLRLFKTVKGLEEQLYAMPLTKPFNIERTKIKIIKLLLHFSVLRDHD